MSSATGKDIFQKILGSFACSLFRLLIGVVLYKLHAGGCPVQNLSK